MKISDLLRMSISNLARRKGRTALTVIGVVVGTCAIVVMISLGLAINANNEAMLASWGDLTKIQVWNYNSGNQDIPTLDDSMLNNMRSWDHVVCATTYYQPRNLDGFIASGRNDRYQCMGVWNLYGAFPDALEPMGITLKSGEYISETTNVGKGKIPVLVGENFGYSFEDTKRSYNSNKRYVWQGMVDANGNPVPPFVDIEKDKMTLVIRATDKNGSEKKETYELVPVGVMNSDYAAGYYTDSGMLLRLSDIQWLENQYKKLAGIKDDKNSTNKGYNEAHVKVDSVDNVSEVQKKIEELGYETYSMTQIREEMQANVARSQAILGGLAAISLLVAALNIANTMTMAIYERTREIGVMKVLGCELGHIRAMFLIESGAIGLLGGIIGSILSLIISFIMNHLAMIAALFGGSVDLSGILSSMSGGWGGAGDTISIVPLWLILLALGFATMVGLLSGIAPAGRAVKISALEAIRRE